MRKEIGIIGYPLGHTMSPTIHESAFNKLGLDMKFNIWETKPENLEQAIHNLRNNNILGSCVTLPHKFEVMNFLDELDETAVEMKAVNWIVNDDGKLVGHNTDWEGFTKSLDFINYNIQNKISLILGAGGSAKAVCMSLIKGESKKIYIYNRTKANSTNLVENFSKYKNRINIIEKNNLEDPKFLNDIDIIINTTSLGMTGGPNPSISPINTDIINKNALCYDLVYSPSITPFLNGAMKNNIKYLGGLSMLVFQAALGFKLTTKLDPPIANMLKSVGIES
ncbi:MAG: shikimate dehydrogenase [SAR202 cluster bacterium]|nr:shikimate dehydrogenase [SAR202 cluster bacterium]RZP18272.1 MAG: shikimate dehydrogenase [Chloroflexota bacterium]|tara:strand:+ start:207 stop:1046 length:840 start_codon:yes stop_codon:yes gene_type:complete